MHDKLYDLGFTEAAGNFQVNNFGRGGLGDDGVQADSQDGSGTNNANFSTPPDGASGRMQMFVYTGPIPQRDSDLAAEVIMHEYTHGLSNGLIGGGVLISALQSRGLGEGWSDFYALSLLSEASDDVNGNYPWGGYVTYQLAGFTENYYYGIRRYPYSVNLMKNPLTFKDIDLQQASTHAGIPRNPIVNPFANEVHNMGEVWCVTLWEARANLIAKFGWPTGNQLTLELVTDGMKLAPANPTFLEARDAIVQADLVLTGGENRDELWAAFAKRGMGASATSPASSTTTGLVEAFDLPTLTVYPSLPFIAKGINGGPFDPASHVYTLINSSTSPLHWSATKTQPWLDLSADGGTLGPGASTTVSASINDSASALIAGSYNDTITFANSDNGTTQVRLVTLNVSTELYTFPLDTDPGWMRQGQWAFGTPSGGGGASHGYPDPTSGFTGANVLGVNLNGDYSLAVSGPHYVTAGPFNFSGYSNTSLKFRRWLNSTGQPYVSATIEASRDGTTWKPIWENGTSEITDSAWTTESYDLSAIADDQPAVYVRWGYQVADGATAYSGWNIDDIELIGLPNPALIFAGIQDLTPEGKGSVGKYTTSGATINADLLEPEDRLYPLGLAASKGYLYIGNVSLESVLKCTTSGEIVNFFLISSIGFPDAIAVSGDNLFTLSSDRGTIGKYTTSGIAINRSLITGLLGARDVAVSGENLFVTSSAGIGGGTIGKYTTSGQVVNAALVTGLDSPIGVAVSGENLYVTNQFAGTVGKYTTSGETVNASLITGLDHPKGIAVFGGDLYVVNSPTTIGKYTISGQIVSSSLISGPFTGKIAVVPAALRCTSVVSRKMHGSLGPFDTSLPLYGQPGVECRASGGIHTLVFYFTNDVISGNARVTSGAGVIATAPTFSGNTIIVTLSEVTDVQRLIVTLDNVRDNFDQVLPSTAVSMIMLVGDTSGNKTVNATDVSQTKVQSGQAITASNFRADVNADGSINATDVSLVKLRSGTALP